jgi:FMN phosphatase YigB (HAD superfamily)
VADKRKTLVLFDVGGVLLSLNFQNFYDRAAALSGFLTPADFKRRYVLSGIDFLACKGLVSRRESVHMLRGLIGPREPVSDEIIESAVESAWMDPVREIVELKRRVHEAGYPVGILSNITELALEQISSRHPDIFETFDGRSPKLYSCRLGAMKPEPEIYQAVTGYGNVIFIDDKELYVYVPVRHRGWKGIWLTPWIDEAESLRAVHGGGARDDSGVDAREGPSENELDRSGDFRRADSVNELIGHLRDFGVELA